MTRTSRSIALLLVSTLPAAAQVPDHHVKFLVRTYKALCGSRDFVCRVIPTVKGSSLRDG